MVNQEDVDRLSDQSPSSSATYGIVDSSKGISALEPFVLKEPGKYPSKSGVDEL